MDPEPPTYTIILALAVWKRGNSHRIFRHRVSVIYLTAILPNILGHDDTEAVEGPGLPHGPHLLPGQGGGVKPVDGGEVFTGEGGEASCMNITKTTSTQCQHPPVRITLLLRVPRRGKLPRLLPHGVALDQELGGSLLHHHSNLPAGYPLPLLPAAILIF